MKIQPGQILKARSIGDYDCIYEIKVLSRTAKTATIEERGSYPEQRRTKIHTDERGEYLRPDRYSFAPTFRPEPEQRVVNQRTGATAPANVIDFYE